MRLSPLSSICCWGLPYNIRHIGIWVPTHQYICPLGCLSMMRGISKRMWRILLVILDVDPSCELGPLVTSFSLIRLATMSSFRPFYLTFPIRSSPFFKISGLFFSHSFGTGLGLEFLRCRIIDFIEQIGRVSAKRHSCVSYCQWLINVMMS